MRVVFLDRDGTLNVDRGYVADWSRWEFIEGSIDALLRLQQAGYRLAVVSNQSGIARKMYAREDVDLLHARMTAEFRQSGVNIDAVVYCPHGPDSTCDCRKPNPGLARQVEKILDGAIDYGTSWTIGDKVSDICFGRAVGTQTALIRSAYWNSSDLKEVKPDLVAEDLREAVNGIVGRVFNPSEKSPNQANRLP